VNGAEPNQRDDAARLRSEVGAPGAPPSMRSRVLALLIAAIAAGALGALAPADWPQGEATVVVTYRGDSIETPATLGDETPFQITGTIGGVEVRTEFPSGLPAGAAVEAALRLTRGDVPLRPGLSDVGLAVALPDGRVEPIPILRWDEATESLEATRRPPQDAGIVLGLLGFVVIMWVSETVPLFVTSLVIPVVLVVADVGSSQAALAPFFHPIIALFFAGFLMAEAMHRCGLDRRVATWIVARAGRSPMILFGAMLGTAAFLSMWMSNTAAAAVMVPIALTVTEPMHHLGFRKAAVLGIAYAATIGGVGSAIGTPANPLAIEFLDSFAGRKVSFAEWFGFGLPVVAVMLPLMAGYVWLRSKVHIDPGRFGEVRQLARAQIAEHRGLDRDQWTVVIVFAGVMVMWLTQTIHDIDTGIVALGGAVVLAALGKIRPDDLGRISWSSLLTFGGGLTLGLFLVESGSADWVATELGGLTELPTLLATGVVALISLGLTTVASNTASAAVLIPMAIPLAGIVGVDPVLMVVLVAVATSIDFALVIGTPPTMIAYSARLHTAKEIFTTGIVIDAAGIVFLVTVVTTIWQWLGLV
jgi:sodium-dependent dicarboxylate transporter 2/3/5